MSETRILAPEECLFRHDDGGMLQLRVKDEEHARVKLRCAFPLSVEAGMVSVRDAADADEAEIGVLEDVSQLSSESRAAVLRELRTRYFVPRINRVKKLEDVFGHWYWSVETDRGPREFAVADASNNVRVLDDGGLLITDTAECRYHVPKVAALDGPSRRLLHRHIPL